MLLPLLLALLPVPQDSRVWFEVPLAEVEFAEGMPANLGWTFANPVDEALGWPVDLEGEGRAVFATDASVWMPSERLATGRLCVERPGPGEVHGVLWLPQADAEGLRPHAFRLPEARGTATEASFLAALSGRYARLASADLPGAAWFRREAARLRETAGLPADEEESAAEFGTARVELEDTLALFAGRRALAENLQLDRLLPITEAEEETVAVADLPGLEVPAFDWTPHLDEEPPALDALASLVPADQPAVFFPSWSVLAGWVEELERAELFLGGLDPSGVALADARDRLLSQLALPWNEAVRALGARVVRSVALTSSDPAFASGTDAALVFETEDPDALLTLFEGLRAAAAPNAEALEGESSGVAWRGARTPGRTLSSYAARIGDAVVVTNSRVQLEALARTAAGETEPLADVPEYRFFRQRTPVEEPAALLVVPDGAIRRWGGARWRIATSRRVRATAILADLQARHLVSIVEGRQVRMRPEERFPMGGLQLLERFVSSELWGTLAFQTPVAELSLTRVGAREAELYRAWLDGYARNWSGAFDPIGLALRTGPEGVDADLSVMPLIEFSRYAELRGTAGAALLEPGDGDPHPEALFQVVTALDRSGGFLAEFEPMATGMLGIGADPFSWIGEWATVYLDRDAALLERLKAGEGGDAPWEEDWRLLPLAFEVEVASSLKLAAFLTGLRTLVEQTAPGMVAWKDDAEGDRRFVHVTSPMDEAFGVWYATTPDAWVLSTQRATLLRALERLEARGAEDAPTVDTPWAGASAGMVLSREAADLLDALSGGELARNLRRLAWSRLPILEEWRRLAPDTDPALFHERYWGERLRDPGGGTYRWNAELGAMESSVFGSPRRPGEGVRMPAGLEAFERLTLSVTFELDGLRVRGRLAR